VRLLLLTTLLCWFQPTAPAPPSGFALTIAGVRSEATRSDEGDYTLDGVQGRRWCAEVPYTGTFEWGVSALWSGGEVPGSNSPRVHYRSTACRMDFNEDGAVGLSDVSSVLGRLGEACRD